jgi:hypothetical protein
MGFCQGCEEPPQTSRLVRGRSSVFYDPLAVTGTDPDHSEVEERLITFGMSSAGQLLVVSHTERGETIRIVSARKATHHERQIYEEG